MSIVRRILVVDNDEDFLAGAEGLLKLEGYEVASATSVEKARTLLRQEYFHVVIVDKRLREHQDEKDMSGLELAADVDEQIGKIIITAYPSAADAPAILGPYETQIKPYPVFVTKRHDPSELLSAVEQVFREQVGINADLEIDYREGAEPEDLVSQMTDFKAGSAEERQRAAQELDNLFRKLFRVEQVITVYRMTPGRGGSGVALTRPRYRNLNGELAVVKFGRRKDFEQEAKRYREYIDPFLPRFATFMRGDPAWTQWLGGAKFLFVGMSGDQPRDFRDFFLDWSVTKDQVTRAIRNIFARSWAIWYDGKLDWEEKAHDLLKSFTEDLFRRQKHWDELRDSVNALLDGKAFRGVSFRRSGKASDQIEMRMGKREWLLPDPVDFLTSNTHLIPKPRYTCVIHGDLNPHNIFIDESLNAWLIDFFKTGEGPALRDVADLESSVKFQLLQTSNLAALLEFESATLVPTTLSEEIEFKNTFKLRQLDRALAAIQELRSIAYEIAEDEDVQEYYASLLFFAAKMITWQGISSAETERTAIRQRHALFSAGILCEKLLPKVEVQETEEVIV